MDKIEVLENGNIKVRIPLLLRKISNRKRAIDMSEEADGDVIAPLAVQLARAFRWRSYIDEGKIASPIALAKALNLDKAYVNRTLRMTFLSPEIIHMILNNTAPETLKLETFRGALPVLWREQHELFKIE